MLLGKVEPVSSGIKRASSSLLQEMKHNHIQNAIIIWFSFLIYETKKKYFSFIKINEFKPEPNGV